MITDYKLDKRWKYYLVLYIKKNLKKEADLLHFRCRKNSY